MSIYDKAPEPYCVYSTCYLGIPWVSISSTSLILAYNSIRDGGSLFFHCSTIRHRATVRIWCTSFFVVLEMVGWSKSNCNTLGVKKKLRSSKRWSKWWTDCQYGSIYWHCQYTGCATGSSVPWCISTAAITVNSLKKLGC